MSPEHELAHVLLLQGNGVRSLLRNSEWVAKTSQDPHARGQYLLVTPWGYIPI